MKIQMQYSDTSDGLSYKQWDIGITGFPVDKRGESSYKFSENNSSEIFTFKYVPGKFNIEINKCIYNIDEIQSVLSNISCKNILIDSNNLGVAEILMLLQLFKDTKVSNLDILYIEPAGYKRKYNCTEILHLRDFELSESYGFEAIPGHALIINKEVTQKIIFLCGYEAERIERALEDLEIFGQYCSCIFGVPAFCPGWEMDSFDNNINVIKDRKISGGIHFCGATNPLAVYQELNDIYKSLDRDEQMFVVPMATKPMNIGASLFLIDKPKDKVAILYDHPCEIAGRTENISKWHLFKVEF